jgi:hypothetical protein
MSSAFVKADLARRRAVADQIAQAAQVIRRSVWGAGAPAHSLELDWDYDSIAVHYTGHEHLTRSL